MLGTSSSFSNVIKVLMLQTNVFTCTSMEMIQSVAEFAIKNPSLFQQAFENSDINSFEMCRLAVSVNDTIQRSKPTVKCYARNSYLIYCS